MFVITRVRITELICVVNGPFGLNIVFAITNVRYNRVFVITEFVITEFHYGNCFKELSSAWQNRQQTSDVTR